jgi:Flp pilus assembly protein TadD
MGAAGESLLLAGSEQRRAGDLGQASMTLERALRIEPHQPVLWLELARVRLDEGNFGQAEQLAHKASSLTPSGGSLAESIRAVIDEARRGQEQTR